MSIIDTHKSIIAYIFKREFNVDIEDSKIQLDDMISSISYYSVEYENTRQIFKIISTSDEHTVIYKNKDLMYVFNRDDFKL